jgi:hypothetical protein
MHFRIIMLLSNFMQILNSKWKHLIKNDYFLMPILFTRISLLQEQKLTPNKYSRQEINKINFFYKLMTMMFTCMYSLEV